MSVCIIGNSHLAALKLGLAQPEAKTIDPRTIQFWGAPGKIVAEAHMRAGRLTIREALLKWVHMTSHGVSAVDPTLYQAVVVHALGLNLPAAILEIARAGRPSTAFLQAAVTSFLHGSEAFRIVTEMRERAPDIPYVLSLQPCSSERVLAPDQPSPVPAALRKEMLALFDKAVAAEGLKLLAQPSTTLSDRVNHTRAQYADGSVRLTSDNLHPESDTQHMNPAYGVLVLKGLVSMLKQKLTPDAPEAPVRPAAPENATPAAGVKAQAVPAASAARSPKTPPAPPIETLPAHQMNNRTRHDRHPLHIAAVRAACGVTEPRILSFGCSGGEECNDIAKRWPDAQIFGTDLREGLLEKGRARYGSDRVSFFLSTEENLIHKGPFDVIFAMNVFCRSPETYMVDDVSTIYPFDLFASGVSTLDRHLKPGGLLCVFNTNYFLDDLDLAEQYERLPPVPHVGTIERSNPDGVRCTDLFSTWEGVTYDRLAWDALDKTAVINDEVLRRQEWRAGFAPNGRDLQASIWRKRS